MGGQTPLMQRPGQEIRLEREVVLPLEVQRTCMANPGLVTKVVEAVRSAVEISFDHPDTKMRVLTADEAKRRMEICLATLELAHAEQGYSLHQLCSVLAQLLIDVLRQANEADAVLTEKQDQGRYATGLDDMETEGLRVVRHGPDPAELLPDPEMTADEEEDLSGDLAEDFVPEEDDSEDE
jgi:hypothetical protein